MKSKITLKGNKKDGYVLEITEGRYNKDLQLKSEELAILQSLINKKLK